MRIRSDRDRYITAVILHLKRPDAREEYFDRGGSINPGVNPSGD
jgi:hypothetical protein